MSTKKNVIISSFLILAFILTFFSASVVDVSAEGIVISEDTTWGGEDVIVIDNGSGIVINSGATLTIESGTIIKFGQNNNIVILDGSLVVPGNGGEFAVFTSLKDDSVGGDTNGDGDATSPSLGDWGYILTSNANANISLNYTKISYAGGGYPTLPLYFVVQEANIIEINNSLILNNNGSMLIYNFNEFRINYTNIYNPDFCYDMGGVEFCGSGVTNMSSQPIDVIYVYWGHNDGPTIDPEGDIRGTVLQGQVDYIPFLTESWVPDDPTENTCSDHWWLDGKAHHKHHNFKNTLKGPAGLLKKDDFVLPGNALKIGHNMYYLGKVQADGKIVEGYAIIRYKKGFGKPGVVCGNGVCEPGENSRKCPADCAGTEEPDTSSCYTFLAREAKWKTVEPYLVDPINSRGLSELFVFDNLAASIDKWETAAGIDILGNGVYAASTTLVADTQSPDGLNEVYFGNIEESGAIGVTIIWGIFGGPPKARELIEWDQIYDDVDFDWSSSGEADKMDFESIATHELGHSVGLGDLYDAACSEVTMYGYATEGETKKQSLEDGDIAGIKKLY